MISDVNPFVYSRPIAPEDVIDRDDETRELLRKVVGGHYVRLYAPRKYGKTSLLKRALRDGERREGLVPVLVDLYRVASLADVTIRFERAYAKYLKGALRAKIEDFLQRTGLGLSLGAFGISAKIQLDPRTESLAALHALLDLPLRLEEGGGFRTFVALDEFQDVSRISDLDGLIRSHIQHQGEVASYVFAGSEPGLMRQLFEDRSRPLYDSAVPMRLGRLPDPAIADYIANRFEQSKRSAGEALNPLLAAALGHPQRAMMLAYHLWEQVAPGETATLDDWSRAHASALTELQPELDAHWHGFSLNDQKTMRSIVAGAGSPYRAGLLNRLELSKSTAQSVVARFVQTAEIEPEGHRYRVVDPLFAEWIERVDSGSLDED